MKVPVLCVPVCLLFFVLGTACSREDQPQKHPPSPKVVQAIQSQPDRKYVPEAKLEEAREGEKGRTEEEPSALTTDTEVKEVTVAEKERAPDEGKPETPMDAKQAEGGVYVARQGDTLMGIAARREIMEDPLKWPILLRLNRDKFGDQPAGADFAARELTPGLMLRFITPHEAKEGVEKPSKAMWAVNVMSTSASTEGEVVSPATILAREGFPAYITSARVKGKDYLRLRIGFFENKGEAADQGERIKKLLGSEEFWVTMVSDGEYEAWAGFLESP
jgi:hypothetical protein